MDQPPSSLASDCGSTQSVYRATNSLMAEHIRVVLALHEVRAAILQRDPLYLTAAFTEVIVAVRDCGKAQEVLSTSLKGSHDTDWHCPHCNEDVPNTFDLCWNCGMLHELTVIAPSIEPQPELVA